MDRCAVESLTGWETTPHREWSGIEMGTLMREKKGPGDQQKKWRQNRRRGQRTYANNQSLSQFSNVKFLRGGRRPHTSPSVRGCGGGFLNVYSCAHNRTVEDQGSSSSSSVGLEIQHKSQRMKLMRRSRAPALPPGPPPRSRSRVQVPELNSARRPIEMHRMKIIGASHARQLTALEGARTARYSL